MVPPTSVPTSQTVVPAGQKQVLLPLGASVLAAVILVAAATAMFIVVMRQPTWWRGWWAALAVSLTAAVCSLAPVAAGLSIGIQGAAYGYLAGAFIRVLVSISGALAAIWVFHVPAASTLLLMVPLFFAQLLAESISLSRALGRRTERR